MSPASGDLMVFQLLRLCMVKQVSIQLMSPASGDAKERGIKVNLKTMEFPFN